MFPCMFQWTYLSVARENDVPSATARCSLRSIRSHDTNESRHIAVGTTKKTADRDLVSVVRQESAPRLRRGLWRQAMYFATVA